MRRLEDAHGGRQAGTGRPFRVLAPPDSSYLTAPPLASPPPPPRAPEPYKVAPASSSYGRAHRRSSFVIIAETRPATPDSRSPSPTLATGRASPFRGRGFKPPPSRSRSRPQSPDGTDGRRHVRNDRRISVSQQNSPRRSLIPQPTRRRSTSLTKTNELSPSPRVGRRVDSRNRLNASDSRSRLNVSDPKSRFNLSDSRSRLNATNGNDSSSTRNGGSVYSIRRQPTRPGTRLSPIQGTPTKPSKPNPQGRDPLRRDRSKDGPRPSVTNSSRRNISPPKGLPHQRRSNQDKTNSNKDRLTSPSKIPLKINKFGSTNSLNNNRFISTPNQQKVSEKRAILGDSNDCDDTGKNSTESSGKLNDSGSSKSSSGDKVEEIALIDLLKQTTGATGTSSMVNTATTTAVQPLHIDANAVLVERIESGMKRSNDQSSSQGVISGGKSTNSTISRDESPVTPIERSGDQRNGQGIDDGRSANSRSSRVAGNAQRTRNTNETKGSDSPAGTDSIGGQSKNSGVSIKNLSRLNSIGQTSGTGSANQRSNSRSQLMTNDQSTKINRTNDQKSTGEPSSGSSSVVLANGTNEGNQFGSLNRNLSTRSVLGADRTLGVSSDDRPSSRNSSSVENITSKNLGGKAGAAENRVTKNSSRVVADVDAKGATATSSSSSTNPITTSSSSAINASTTTASQQQATTMTSTATSRTNNNVAVKSVDGAVNVPSGANNAEGGEGPRGGAKEVVNRGSDASLKSSTGRSSGSIESVRSTDTGVSVDTVKGVSSPREKTGVHMVKRPQEIETLSGNVMHHEQNGEPAVPSASAAVEESSGATHKLLTRWKAALGRYCKCCPGGMRCLACRRDPKGLLWARGQSRTQATRPVATQGGGAHAANPPTQGCWSKFKTRCRWARLKQAKCCARRARVAPAEAPTPCCPPERRFGAICRRMFSCCSCSCKRSDPQRTRSIRAKHSLTSVAPPPLSEEPKAKIPDVLVEHNSVMRGAIPCLPVPLAWFCLVWNVLLPGSGTVWSGIFNLCIGQPRFSPVASLKSRLGAFIVNLVVGVGQLFTVLFCLVGWGWSIWWGVTMVRLARKYKRFKASEAANGDPEARAGESTALPPGVPSQALRGIERAR